VTDTIDYPRLVREALRDVPRRVLLQVAESGLPGDHHFFLSFRTSDPGVVVPAHLRARHPEELTIVLQHQFWELTVDQEAFSISLRFSGVLERLTVPFASLTAFVDPAAQLMLRFVDAPEEKGLADTSAETPAGDGAVPAPTGDAQASSKAPAGAKPAAKKGRPGPRPVGKVVDLDAFRRK
jgi:hypothetical protein